MKVDISDLVGWFLGPLNDRHPRVAQEVEKRLNERLQDVPSAERTHQKIFTILDHEVQVAQRKMIDTEFVIPTKKIKQRNLVYAKRVFLCKSF